MNVPQSKCSDQCLQQHVMQQIRACGYPELQRLQVTSDRGVVTISGELPNYYLRQLAAGEARRTPEVLRVIDQIRVVHQPHRRADREPEQ